MFLGERGQSHSGKCTLIIKMVAYSCSSWAEALGDLARVCKLFSSILVSLWMLSLSGPS